MKIYKSLTDWQAVRRALPVNASLGFVPTMGNLHQGHASLFKRSLQENDLAITSLFINPTQFNQAADFTHYPRTLDADLALLEGLGVHHCILPERDEIYADGYRYHIEEQVNTRLMEGRLRPGHFTGVLTVVMKLLNLVKPHRAYFGEKDYQQFELIRDMVSAFFLDIEIKACPIIREPSGLACSSRNTRLTSSQRQIADQFAKTFHQDKPCETILAELRAMNIDVDYLEEHNGRRFTAVYVGDIRLIDNIEQR